MLRQLPRGRETLDRDLDIRIDLVQSLYPLGRVADLRDYLLEAERLAEMLEDRLRLARVSAYISNQASITGDLPRALASGQRALALAEGSPTAGSWWKRISGSVRSTGAWASTGTP